MRTHITDSLLVQVERQEQIAEAGTLRWRVLASSQQAVEESADELARILFS